MSIFVAQPKRVMLTNIAMFVHRIQKFHKVWQVKKHQSFYLLENETFITDIIDRNLIAANSLRISSEIQEMPTILCTNNHLGSESTLGGREKFHSEKKNHIKRNFHIFIYCFFYLRRSKCGDSEMWVSFLKIFSCIHTRLRWVGWKSIELNNHLMYLM